MCACSEYEDLEFLRKVITKRLKDSRILKKQLEVVAKHPEKEHKLYRCNSCCQFWQGSRAWNWGNDEYLFKVPTITPEEWLVEVFVQPDELLIFTGALGRFLEENTFTDKEELCSVKECSKKSVSGTLNCLRHHIESLQRGRVMPAYPSGRWFEPYERENIVPAL